MSVLPINSVFLAKVPQNISQNDENGSDSRSSSDLSRKTLPRNFRLEHSLKRKKKNLVPEDLSDQKKAYGYDSDISSDNTLEDINFSIFNDEHISFTKDRLNGLLADSEDVTIEGSNNVAGLYGVNEKLNIIDLESKCLEDRNRGRGFCYLTTDSEDETGMTRFPNTLDNANNFPSSSCDSDIYLERVSGYNCLKPLRYENNPNGTCDSTDSNDSSLTLCPDDEPLKKEFISISSEDPADSEIYSCKIVEITPLKKRKKYQNLGSDNISSSSEDRVEDVKLRNRLKRNEPVPADEDYGIQVRIMSCYRASRASSVVSSMSVSECSDKDDILGNTQSENLQINKINNDSVFDNNKYPFSYNVNTSLANPQYPFSQLNLENNFNINSTKSFDNERMGEDYMAHNTINRETPLHLARTKQLKSNFEGENYDANASSASVQEKGKRDPSLKSHYINEEALSFIKSEINLNKTLSPQRNPTRTTESTDKNNATHSNLTNYNSSESDIHDNKHDVRENLGLTRDEETRSKRRRLLKDIIEMEDLNSRKKNFLSKSVFKDSPQNYSAELLEASSSGLDSSSSTSESQRIMSRLNGRVHHTGTPHNPVQYQPVPTQYGTQPVPHYQDNTNAPHREEYEPSCLRRTASGNVYIPSEDLPKNSALDYKQSVHSPSLHSPTKGDQKSMEHYNTHFGSNIGMPVLPLRNNLRRPRGSSPPSSYESPLGDRGGSGVGRRHLSLHQHGGMSPLCSWRCTAIVFIAIACILAGLLGFFAAKNVLSVSSGEGGCGVIIDDTSALSEDPLISHSPTRGNQKLIKSDEFQGIFSKLPDSKFLLLEQIGLGSPTIQRMRRSVSHDLESSMKQKSLNPASTFPPVFSSSFNLFSLNTSVHSTLATPVTSQPPILFTTATPPYSTTYSYKKYFHKTNSDNTLSYTTLTSSDSLKKSFVGNQIDEDKQNFMDKDNLPLQSNIQNSSKKLRVYNKNSKHPANSGLDSLIDIVEYSENQPVVQSTEGILEEEYDKLLDDDDDQATTEYKDYVYGNIFIGNTSELSPVYEEENNSTVSQPPTPKEYMNLMESEKVENDEDLEQFSLPPLSGFLTDNFTDILSTTDKVKIRKPLIMLKNDLEGKQFIEKVRSRSFVSILNSSHLSPDQMLGDDPQLYNPTKTKTRVGSRDLWSLGWIYTNNNYAHEVNSDKSSQENDNSVKEISQEKNGENYTTEQTEELVTFEDESFNETKKLDPVPEEVSDEAYNSQFDSYSPSNKRKINKGGKHSYKPFSTWSKANKDGKPKKGGKETVFVNKQDTNKGGKVTEININPQDKDYYKRSTRSKLYPSVDYYYQRYGVVPYNVPYEKPDKQRNPRNPISGKVQSPSSQYYPSKLLRSLTFADQNLEESKDVTDTEETKVKGNKVSTAYDLFPHIFEYDLPDHDDYYYEEDKDWFDEFWTTEDDTEDYHLSPEDSKPRTHEKIFSRESDVIPVVEHRQSHRQFPEGLQVMSLKRENFQVEEPNIPKAVSIDKKGRLYGYNEDEIEIIPLEDEKHVSSPSDIQESVNLKNFKKKVLHKTANDVYIHPSIDEENIIPVGKDSNSVSLSSIQNSSVEGKTLVDNENHIKYSVLNSADSNLDDITIVSTSTEYSSQSSISLDLTTPTEPTNTDEKIPSTSNTERYIPDSTYPTNSEVADTTTENVPLKANEVVHKVETPGNKIYENPLDVVSVARSDNRIDYHNISRHTKRVTVNVTIGAEDSFGDSKSSARKPFYILSVSVPTSGENGKPEIRILDPESKNHDEDQFQVFKKEQSNDPNLDSRTNSLVHPQIPNQRDGNCDCKCPCEETNKMNEKSNLSKEDKLINSDTLSTQCNSSGISSSNQEQNRSAQGVPTAPSTTTTTTIPTTTTTKPTTTTTIPTLPPHFYFELKEHKQRPHQTIPPDGTTFRMMELGHKLKHKIPPYGYWNMQFYQPESAYVKFEIAVPRGASLGIYGRRNALPTHTSYDFLQVLSGYKVGSARNARSSLAPTQVETLVKYLDQGHWFLSVYNDDGDPQELSLGAEVSSEFTEGCPKGCSGNGDCILGSCQCYPGFAGPDCMQMKCPVLCSGHGEYKEGQCVCRPGWKGQECSVRHDECEVPDCSGHGHCVDGKCLCAKGFKGEFCEDVDCPHPTCSGHGWCVNGTCICQKGWRGPDCARMDDATLQCLPDCSGHGHFDLIGQQCVCEPEWTGSECDKRVCGLDCGYHGRCEGDQCLCNEGWTGDRCDLMICDPRCEDHGQCKNGTCICMTGWNGRHCTLPGCPGMCSSQGSCVMSEEEWTCSCQNGWEGPDCSVMLESSCEDGVDNDNDGLTDCADAECCSSTSCTHSTLCKSSVDPIDILLRKQPPAVTASFFQRMRFIVEENSVQLYTDVNAFNQSLHRIHINESRASVVRGRIISGRGSGLVGVRVSHFRPKDTGFTLSRHGGWFDLMVNGGGAVKLHFGKSQFLPLTKTVWVPWNEIVVIGTVVLTTTEIVPPPPPTTCPDHDYITLKPVVLATWKHGFQGGCSECSAILTESQVLQESLPIPGTGLYLVYHSSRALGYESTIQLQLTPSSIPSTLRRIYLRITIEGILFEKTFEADTDIKFTYAWNRLNVYRQRVYGVTWAIVRVGYAYSNCDQIIWDTQSTQVSGHDMSVSDIGGWDLSIHHRYNFHEGILQKGDGSNMYLKQRPRILKTLMGDGRQREVNCRSCEGPAKRQRLLTPAALAPAPDGSLYVADFNLIRRIFPDKSVKTVVRLNETRVSYRYHLTVSPVDGSVYISDPEAHQILKVKDPDDTSRPEENFIPHVGSGERCLPGDEIGCGDGGLARDAKLQYPKGMAISSDDVLYFADGTNVRSVDSDGIISTVIGTHRHRSHWQPLPCSGTLSVVDVGLRWPISLAVSPLDESLYVLDDHHILRLTTDGRVKVVAGRPLHCPPLSKNGPTDLAAQTTLRSPQSIAFTPNGDLYIAESDTERINRIRIIHTDERIHDFAGAESKCNCREEMCPCFDEAHVLASTAIFSTISAIAVTPDGAVHVLDQGNLRIRSVIASIPQPTESRDYEIYSPETQEVYIFNRFGHHIETRNIPTQRTLYIFIYNVNTSNGKLSSVTDAAGNKINFLRDYAGQVTMVENSRQQKSRLKMSRMRRLEEMVTPDEHNVTLTYHGASGLLRSRMDSTGRAHVYTYDKYGRLTRTVTPSGQVIDLSFDLSEEGARVTVTRDATSPVTMLIKGTTVTETIGSASSVISQLPDGSVILRNPWGHHIATETVAYTLLRNNILANSFPVHGRQRTEINEELVNSFDWKYFMEVADEDSSIVKQMGRKMRVNGEELLTFKYDLFSGTEAVVNKGGNVLLNVTYDDLGRPLRWTPAEPFHSVSLKYDRYGLLQEWQWGEQKEDYLYDRAGRFEGITYADGSKISYSYKDLSSIKPYKVAVHGGTEHLLEYDEGGALSSITTPRGHKYFFQIQPSVLHNRFTFTPPGSPRHPYQILYSDNGKLLAKVLPQQAGRVIYNYDEAGRLQHQIFGDGSVEYGYQPETGLIRSVTLRELAYEQRIDNKYHAGLVKEQRVRFGPAVPLNAAKMRFLYDGNARPRRVEIEINGKELPDYEMKYDMIRGTLENVDDMKITRSRNNKTVIQDSRKTVLRVSNYDSYGRIQEETLSIHGRLLHRLRYVYDLRGRLASKTTWRGPGSLEYQSNYSYTTDGYLESVEGAESWQFRYDSNGNMISVVEGGREITSIYDSSDRLVDWGDDQINIYDTAGRVIQQRDVHFSYTARGNIRHAWKDKHFRVTYRHDHKGRLTSWEDHLGNVTQFFYADLRRTSLPTHIHYPSIGLTHTMFYNDRGHLTAMQTENGRLWIITDSVGTPLSVYDSSGVLVKEILRSPWGETLRDTKPEIRLHIDFFGSIRDPVTGFLIFGMYPYDPKHGQWMIPRYDRVPNTPEKVTSIYMHRFHDNNPINSYNEADNHYTDTHNWLKLFGIDMDRMLGSKYHDETIDDPLQDLETPNIEPSLRVISGLSCSKKGVLSSFSRPSLLPESLVQIDEPRLASSTWSMLGRFSSSGPVLGPGILVSRVNERALVTLVPYRENSVVQAVARDVLNGSSLLDLTLPHHRHHTLYLLKEDVSAKDDDLEQLQRLSGLFNVTSHEGEHPEIRVIGYTTSLVFIYGTTPEAARHRLLRHVHHRAAEHAWQAEKRLLESGGPSLHPWTSEEKDILLREGQVPGFVAAELHSVHRFPLLADDASNVVFRKDVDRRRRRSRVLPQS